MSLIQMLCKKGHENEKYGYRKCEYRFLRLLMQLKYLYFSTSFVLFPSLPSKVRSDKGLLLLTLLP